MTRYKMGSLPSFLAAIVLIWFAMGPVNAYANRTINSATLDGASSVIVAPSASITAVVNVTTNNTGSSRWRSTGWRISTTAPGTVTCVNHGNHDSAGGPYSETFSITAPVAAGTYNAYFIAYSDDACSSNASATYTMSSAVLVVVPPTVSSINPSSTNPTAPATSVSWTVTFSTSVTGVDALDFSLVQAGGVSGASITSVTGSGTTWTVTANTGSGGGSLGLNLGDNDSILAGSTSLGGTGAGNGNFTGQTYNVVVPFSCTPPANTPAGLSLTCVCDTFSRATLNPSTIFGANWIVSTSDGTGILPSIVNSGYLRLTNNTSNNAKAATVPGIFPAAGNYISVEFQQYAYNGSGADGIAVTLSDYSVPAVPGAFGGSLGYAQRTGVVGFAGGWLGVAMDEYGNYQNPTEGRIGGSGFIVDSVGARGSGSGMNGYNWLGGTATLTPQIDNNGSATPSLGYYYQVIVDARNEPTSTAVAVNRDAGAGYNSLIGIPNVYSAATAKGFTQSPVPPNWQISFTGSTGGSTNIHEIGSVRICASTIWPPSGGTASGFNAIDEAYGNASVAPRVPVQNYLSGHVYTKLVGTPFKLNVAALSNNQIQTAYVVSGSKSVTVKLVDNSDGVCVIDNTQPNYCGNSCTSKTAVTGGSQTLTFTSTDLGQKQSANFTLNSAYRNLVAIISDGTVNACSTDAFSVRPASIASVASSNATNAATSGAPMFKAGSDNFSLTATSAGVAGNPSGYTGVLKINNAALQVVSPATAAGVVTGTFPAATSGTPSSTATGSTFTYSEVGAFMFPGFDPTTNATSPRGVFDGVATATECTNPGLTAAQCDALRTATWTGIDSISTKSDCVANSYSNVRDTGGTFTSNSNFGKFGCDFGLAANTAEIGRFTPDHFDTAVTHSCIAGGFSYSGQPFTVQVTAKNAGGNKTLNYNAAAGFSKAVTLSAWDSAGAVANPGPGNVISAIIAASAFTSLDPAVALVNTPAYAFTSRQTAPTTIRLRATDTDAISSATGNEGTTTVRSGRASLSNAHGSELLDLPVPFRVEYWSGSWLKNTDDTCTADVTLALADVTVSDGLVPGETCVLDSGNPGISGIGCSAAGVAPKRFVVPPVVADFRLWLKAPGSGNSGALDLTATVPAWLQFNWKGIGVANPSARVTFGVNAAKKSPIIYMRENY